jgi:hypothetical protein
VLNWGDVGADLEVRVRCVDAAGAPKNTKFTILVVGHNSLQGRSGFAWANEPSSPSYIPTTLYSWTTAPDLIGISRFGPGRYIVDLKLPRPRGGLPENYFVTTFGDPNDMCKIISWDANATVFCYDKSGVYTDAYYDILLVEQGRPGRRLGFAWANQQAVGSYFPSAQYRRNSSLGSVFITRSGTGRYSVRFEGLVRAPGRTETVQVSSYGAFYTYCTVVNWYNTFPSDMLVNVECRDRLGALADSRYTVLLIE